MIQNTKSILTGRFFRSLADLWLGYMDFSCHYGTLRVQAQSGCANRGLAGCVKRWTKD